MHLNKHLVSHPFRKKTLFEFPKKTEGHMYYYHQSIAVILKEKVKEDKLINT